MVTAAVTLLQPEQALEAAGYIRVSHKVQAEGHSPDIQREAIKRVARHEGYILADAMIKEDDERGSRCIAVIAQQPAQGLTLHLGIEMLHGCAGGAAGAPEMLRGHVGSQGMQALLPAAGLQGAHAFLQLPLVGEVVRDRTLAARGRYRNKTRRVF
jgi:hypothetical protein